MDGMVRLTAKNINFYPFKKFHLLNSDEQLENNNDEWPLHSLRMTDFHQQFLQCLLELFQCDCFEIEIYKNFYYFQLNFTLTLDSIPKTKITK
jgi:hypothetical protein